MAFFQRLIRFSKSNSSSPVNSCSSFFCSKSPANYGRISQFVKPVGSISSSSSFSTSLCLSRRRIFFSSDLWHRPLSCRQICQSIKPDRKEGNFVDGNNMHAVNTKIDFSKQVTDKTRGINIGGFFFSYPIIYLYVFGTALSYSIVWGFATLDRYIVESCKIEVKRMRREVLIEMGLINEDEEDFEFEDDPKAYTKWILSKIRVKKNSS